MLLLSVCTFMMSSCDDDDTYADMKDKEKRAINSFLLDNEFCGPIKVISEEEFLENDTTTDVSSYSKRMVYICRLSIEEKAKA